MREAVSHCATAAGCEKEHSLNIFIGLDIAAGARIDTSKPETQKLFFTGFTIGAEY